MKGIDKIRHCFICGKKLSRYNPEDICFHHQSGMPIVHWAPTTSCTGYEKNMGEGMELKPGDPGYNDLAFAQSIDGAVNYQGEVVEFNF